jgi:hypothetical protein
MASRLASVERIVQKRVAAERGVGGSGNGRIRKALRQSDLGVDMAMPDGFQEALAWVTMAEEHLPRRTPHFPLTPPVP